MKKRRGSTLVLTIMVFVILMILSTALLNVMVTNSKQAAMHRDKIQAYYIARSGAEIAEAAIMQMNEEQIEELEGKERIDFSITEFKPEFEVGNLDSVTISKEEDNKSNLIITSKASVKEREETVVKVMERNEAYTGGGIGGYRGVIKKYDNIEYLPEPTESKPNIEDDDKYKIIYGRKYKKIGKDDFENDFKKNELEGNYYLDFDFEKKYKSLDLKIENVNIYTTSKFELEVDSLDMNRSSIISESEKDLEIKAKKRDIKIDFSEIISYGKKTELEIEAKKGDIEIKNTAIISYGNESEIEIESESGDIDIYNSTIISYGEEVEIEIESEEKNTNGKITIERTVIKAREEIKIEIESEEKNANGKINIIDTTIVAGDRGGKGEVEIEIESEKGNANGKISIENSVIKAMKEIEIEIDADKKNANGKINIDESTLIVEKAKDGIEIKIESDEKNAKGDIIFKGSKLIIDDLDKIDIKLQDGAIRGLKEEDKIEYKTVKDFYQYPGMPTLSGSSDGNKKERIYKPSYFKK